MYRLFRCEIPRRDLGVSDQQESPRTCRLPAGSAPRRAIRFEAGGEEDPGDGSLVRAALHAIARARSATERARETA